MNEPQIKDGVQCTAEDVPSPSTTASYIRSSVKASVDMELKRCDSLRRMSGTVLTCASIISVAVVTAAAPLFGFFQGDAGLSKVLLGILCLSLTALFVAILLALVSQLRFAYVALPNPITIRQTLDNGELFTEMDVARHYSEDIDEVFEGLCKKDDTMCRFLTASSVAVFVALAVLMIGAAILLPCVYGMVG